MCIVPSICLTETQVYKLYKNVLQTFNFVICFFWRNPIFFHTIFSVKFFSTWDKVTTTIFYLLNMKKIGITNYLEHMQLVANK